MVYIRVLISDVGIKPIKETSAAAIAMIRLASQNTATDLMVPYATEAAMLATGPRTSLYTVTLYGWAA